MSRWKAGVNDKQSADSKAGSRDRSEQSGGAILERSAPKAFQEAM
jgi:hypothetical protein